MMDFLHAMVAIGKGHTWGLSPIHDDGTPATGGWVDMSEQLDPEAQIVGVYAIEETDPVAAAAYAASVNKLLGRGFAQPWRPDPKAPEPLGGAPRQRLIELDARCLGNLDERTPVLAGSFKKGDWRGLLDGVLDEGYSYTARDRFAVAYLRDFAEAAQAQPVAPPAPAAPQPLAQQPAAGQSAAPKLAPGALLLLGRFQVSMTYKTSRVVNGQTEQLSGAGTPVELPETEGGTCYFWFFDKRKAEVMVGIVSAGDAGWGVFAGGLTNVGCSLTVKDTKTGAEHTFTQNDGIAFQAIQDWGMHFKAV